MVDEGEAMPESVGAGRDLSEVRKDDRSDSGQIGRSSRLLDRHIVPVWMIGQALGWGVPVAILTIVGLGLVFNTAFPWWMFALVWPFLAVAWCLAVFWYPIRNYSRWSYRVSEENIELRNGVIWRRSVLIPLSRLQHVDLHRGPLERHFGLSSLELHTAGTKNASHTIPGLEDDLAHSLRDELVTAAHLEVL